MHQEEYIMEFYFTDVLVIGGGIAGMRAAIAARERGVEVTLLSKKKAGKSGASLVANTGHRLFSQEQPSEYDFYQETLKSGQGLTDKKLLNVLVNDSVDVIRDLQEWGVPFNIDFYQEKNPNGDQFISDIPLYARCPERKGILITEKLREVCEKRMIKILDNYTVIQLIKDANRIVGVFVTYQDEVSCFLAKTVVLATGGIGQLYQHTDNPVDVKGDAVALAWLIGADLIDLEFVQFYPYQLKSPVFLDIHTLVFRLGARLLNADGEYFMENYPKQELETRDIVSREMFLQNSEIFLDLSNVNLDELEKVNPRLKKLYLTEKNLLVSPIQHFYMGGVRIGVRGQTTIPGLYACGEAAGGLHGANRLGGNALTECNVFGRLIGYAAAEEAKGVKVNSEENFLTTIESQLNLPVKGENNYRQIISSLQELMWTNVGIIRNAGGLKYALCEINRWVAEFIKSKPASITEYFLTKNMLITAGLIVETAIMRRESRGAHYRSDFPQIDPEWENHIIVRNNKKILF